MVSVLNVYLSYIDIIHSIVPLILSQPLYIYISYNRNGSVHRRHCLHMYCPFVCGKLSFNSDYLLCNKILMATECFKLAQFGVKTRTAPPLKMFTEQAQSSLIPAQLGL